MADLLNSPQAGCHPWLESRSQWRELQLKIWSANMRSTNKLIQGVLRGKKWSSQMTMQERAPWRNIVSDQTQISPLLKFNSRANESEKIRFHNKSGRNFKRDFWWKMGVKVKFAVGGKWQLRFLGLFKIPAPQGRSWLDPRNPWLSPRYKSWQSPSTLLL